MPSAVATKHKQYNDFAPKWQRVRDVVSGQDEVYAASVAYLPMLLDETPGAYDARLRRTPFYNASWRTMAAFVGMLFRKPPNLEVPKELEPLLDDVTLSGVNFANFAQEIVLEDIAISRVGVLVDHPLRVVNQDGSGPTVAQAEALNLRPSMSLYKAEAIINWHYEKINNRYVLTQVRLAEIEVIRKNEFENEEEKRIKVLDLIEGKYRIRLFKEENGEQISGDLYPLMDGKPLDFIPFYLIGPDGAQTAVSEPILIDLVDLNLKHFQVSADYEHACHMTALPTPVISGAQEQFHPETGLPMEKSYYIGSTVAWLLPMGAEAKFLEFQGGGLSALENNLTRKENQMAAIGARMLTPEKAGVEASETLAMRNAGEHSILAAIAIATSEGLTRALETFAKWAGKKGEVKFEINRDFMPYAITPQALTALLSAVQAGKLSDESFFDLMKRGDLIEADLNFEDEQSRIDENKDMPPPVLPGGAAPGQPAPGQPMPGKPPSRAPGAPGAPGGAGGPRA